MPAYRLRPACKDYLWGGHRHLREMFHVESGMDPIAEVWLGAFLYYGFEHPVSREEFARRIDDGTVTEVLHRTPARKGDVFFIPAGTIHAIGAGLVIAEIQQNSNVTYRVFDFDRRGPDGKPRTLHIRQAIDVTERGPVPALDFGPHLGRSRCFTVDGHNGAFSAGCGEDSFHALLVTEGTAPPLRRGAPAPPNGGLLLPPGGQRRLQGGGGLPDFDGLSVLTHEERRRRRWSNPFGVSRTGGGTTGNTCC